MTTPHIETIARAMKRTEIKKMVSGILSPASIDAHVDASWKMCIPAATLVWSLARAHTIEEAAKVADAYAEENIMMAQDSIINDPLLSKLCGRNREVTVTEADFEASDSMIVDGTIHSSMFHAAQNIAAAIRALATSSTTQPEKPTEG